MLRHSSVKQSDSFMNKLGIGKLAGDPLAMRKKQTVPIAQADPVDIRLLQMSNYKSNLKMKGVQ